MRLLYTLLFGLLLPWIFVRLYWRGAKAPAYRQRWKERLAIYTAPPLSDVVWFHAVSVGEAEAAFPLIQKLLQRKPDAKILVTTTTPTGSARVRAVLKESVEHVYFPYDLPWLAQRFLKQFKPKMAIFLEKEIWPNVFAQCGLSAIPLIIVNARLSARSAKAYQLIDGFTAETLKHVTAVLAQTEDDARRWLELGLPVDKVKVSGNLKFDVASADEALRAGSLLRRELFPGRFVWIVASTHQGEEDLFLDIFRRLKSEIPELLLLLVPRHPERFESVRKLAENQRLKTVMRCSQDFCKHDTDVYIADTLGELKMLYAAADIGFVGGSMVAAGGHNILEALAVGLPTMFGPHMDNFEEIAQRVLALNAGVQCQTQDDIAEQVLSLHRDVDSRHRLGGNGLEFIAQNRGVTDSVLNDLAVYL